MSRLSEERIRELAEADKWYGASDGWTFNHFAELVTFARAIEKEAYKAGQERMRERAARRVSHFETACAAIRALEIEEPK